MGLSRLAIRMAVDWISSGPETGYGTDMNDDLKREARSLIEKIVHLRDSL